MDEVLRTPIDVELNERIDRLIRFRWLVVLGALFIVFAGNRFLPGTLQMLPLLVVIAILAVCNVLFFLWFRWLRSAEVISRHYAKFIHIQLVLDILLLTIFLHFLGGMETPFFFFYLIYVVIASILLTRTASLVYAGLVSLMYFALLSLEWLEIIPHYNLSGFRIPSRFQQPIHVFTVVFTLAVTALLIVYFTSTIMSKLRERERGLIEANLSCELKTQELAKLNVQLEELDKARAQFTMIVAHELRAPVAAIQSFLKLILEGYVPPEREREIIQKAEQQAMEQLELINDLLRLARLQEPKAAAKLEIALVDLAEIMRGVCDLMHAQAEEKSISLNVQIEAGLPPAKANKEHIKQLWTDLISNAIKYTRPGGTVLASLSQDSNYLVGTVQDTGIGIASEDIPHIFDDFYRAQNAKNMERQGTGLGLPIVKRILETYGGSISVESELDKGSKFTFMLPKSIDSVTRNA